MIQSIVGFGDSWMYGSEVGGRAPGDPERLSKCILGQIGSRLNLPTQNFGRPGSSLTSMLWEFGAWAQQTPDISRHLIIVALTYCERDSWWPEDQSKKFYGTYYVESNQYTHYRQQDQWTDFVKHYITHSNHKPLRHMRYWQAINFLDSYCNQRHIPLLQINVYQPPGPDVVDTLYDPRYNLVEMLQQGIDKTGTMMHTPGLHPNEQGCSYLADILTTEIRQRNLIT